MCHRENAGCLRPVPECARFCRSLLPARAGSAVSTSRLPLWRVARISGGHCWQIWVSIRLPGARTCSHQAVSIRCSLPSVHPIGMDVQIGDRSGSIVGPRLSVAPHASDGGRRVPHRSPLNCLQPPTIAGGLAHGCQDLPGGTSHLAWPVLLVQKTLPPLPSLLLFDGLLVSNAPPFHHASLAP